MKAPLTKEGYKKRLNLIRKVRRDFAKRDVSRLHVRLQKGNSKTGANCYTVSLMPVVDCVNCQQCKMDCYDVKADMVYKQTREDRARNSVIHEREPQRFWDEIDLQIKAKFVEYLRINVGGDLSYDDFQYVATLAENNPRCQFLFFTKNYNGINKYLKKNSFPENVHAIISVWKGQEYENTHDLPCSHVLYPDGTTTAPDWAYFCKGNCTQCAYENTGCWGMKNGDHVMFRYH